MGYQVLLIEDDHDDVLILQELLAPTGSQRAQFS